MGVIVTVAMAMAVSGMHIGLKRFGFEPLLNVKGLGCWVVKRRIEEVTGIKRWRVTLQ